MIFLFLTVCVAGGLVQAVSGFGFVLLVMMFFPYILPTFASGVAVCGILSVLSSGYLSYRMRKFIKWKLILIPASAYFLINSFVISFASEQSDPVLKKMLAAALILLSLYFILSGGKIKFHPTFLNGLIFGSLSGVLGGLFSVSGPPIVLYMLASGEDNDSYMANLQMYFTITSFYSTLLRFFYGKIDVPVLLFSGIGFIAVLAGLYLGNKLFNRLNPMTLRRIIYILMLISGIVMFF